MFEGRHLRWILCRINSIMMRLKSLESLCAFSACVIWLRCLWLPFRMVDHADFDLCCELLKHFQARCLKNESRTGKKNSTAEKSKATTLGIRLKYQSSQHCEERQPSNEQQIAKSNFISCFRHFQHFLYIYPFALWFLQVLSTFSCTMHFGLEFLLPQFIWLSRKCVGAALVLERAYIRVTLKSLFSPLLFHVQSSLCPSRI